MENSTVHGKYIFILLVRQNTLGVVNLPKFKSYGKGVRDGVFITHYPFDIVLET